MTAGERKVKAHINYSLKGVWHAIVDFTGFFMNQFPPDLFKFLWKFSETFKIKCFFVFGWDAAGLLFFEMQASCNCFIAGVNETHDKLSLVLLLPTSMDTGDNLLPMSLTPAINTKLWIFPRIFVRVNWQWARWDTGMGGGGDDS